MAERKSVVSKIIFIGIVKSDVTVDQFCDWIL